MRDFWKDLLSGRFDPIANVFSALGSIGVLVAICTLFLTHSHQLSQANFDSERHATSLYRTFAEFAVSHPLYASPELNKDAIQNELERGGESYGFFFDFMFHTCEAIFYSTDGSDEWHQTITMVLTPHASAGLVEPEWESVDQDFRGFLKSHGLFTSQTPR